MYELTENVAPCTGLCESTPGEVRALRREVDKPLPLIQKLCLVGNHMHERSVLSNGVSLGMQTTLKGGPHALQEMAKDTQGCLWKFFVS